VLGMGWGTAADTPCSMSFLLDCYARAGVTDRFDGDFPLDEDEWVEIINASNVSHASDELVIQVAQLLFNHRCAGLAFFRRTMEANGSVAWCIRLLSPVLEQMGASFGGAEWQFCAVQSPEPHLLHLLQSAGRWDAALNEPYWLHRCGNVEALSLLLKQFDVDWKFYGITPLFGTYRTQWDKTAHQQVTRALLDAGADPRLLVGYYNVPPLAVLEVVFERVVPQTLFPTAAGLLYPEAREDEGPAIVLLLLLKHGYAVDEVRSLHSLRLVFSDECMKECLVKLGANDAQLSREGHFGSSRRCVWYALLFHRLIQAIPPGVISDVRILVQSCMADPDGEHYPVYCRVAWMPHTHHLFPDAFKVMRVVGGWLVGC
jgi:hypothetical protein